MTSSELLGPFLWAFLVPSIAHAFLVEMIPFEPGELPLGLFEEKYSEPNFPVERLSLLKHPLTRSQTNNLPGCYRVLLR